MSIILIVQDMRRPRQQLGFGIMHQLQLVVIAVGNDPKVGNDLTRCVIGRVGGKEQYSVDFIFLTRLLP